MAFSLNCNNKTKKIVIKCVHNAIYVFLYFCHCVLVLAIISCFIFCCIFSLFETRYSVQLNIVTDAKSFDMSMFL